MATPAIGAGYLPGSTTPKSTLGMVYAIAVPLVIGYALYEGGMPEGWHEWLVSIVLGLVAAGFALNLVNVQIAASPAGTTTPLAA